MIRQIVLTTMLAVSCWTGNVRGQSFPEDSAANIGVQTSADPLPEGVIFPQWYRTNYEKETYATNQAIAAEGLLSDVDGAESTEASQEKAKLILSQMSNFLSAQKSVRFTLEYELNQQETMGTVATGRKPFETFDFEFAKPNLLKASCTRKRDDKYRWEVGCDGNYLLRIFSGTVFVEPAADNVRLS